MCSILTLVRARAKLRHGLCGGVCRVNQGHLVEVAYCKFDSGDLLSLISCTSVHGSYMHTIILMVSFLTMLPP